MAALLLPAASRISLAQGNLVPSPQLLQSYVPQLVSRHEARYVGTLSEVQKIQLSIILPLRNQDQLKDLLARLYDPASPDYRKFLSVEEFTDQFGPTVDDYQEVVNFAIANGLTVAGQAKNRLVVPIEGTVAQVNSAFNLQLGEYVHPTEDRTFFSPDREPTIAIRAKIAHIDGLDSLYLPRAMNVIPSTTQPMVAVNGSGPSGSYLGSDMRAAYYGGSTLTGINQKVALVEFGGYLKSDVDLNFSGAGQTYSVPLENILVGSASNTVYRQDGEQVLDIVQAIGMAPNLSAVQIYIGDPTTSASSAAVLNRIVADNGAKQIGCSWGWIPGNIASQEAILQEMMAQGQTFFAASGDAGAFQASISPFFYPAESQFATAVGGTHLTTASAAGAWSSEVAWNSRGAGSGGGISPDKIPIPSWQNGLANSSNGGSTTLRNVPDVSMEGDFDNYVCNLGNCSTTGAGTSFAAPRWAGFMALVNQQAVEAGNAPLGGIGFINNAISQIGTGSNFIKDLHDIQSGNNNTSNQTVWFSAVAGYDLVTGWGSPTGQTLIDDLAGEAVPGFWISSSTSSISIIQGSNATATFSVIDAGGFNGSVNLAVTSTLPSGVTASFNPASTSGSSVLTFTATSSAAQGTYQVNITGTSGSITESTTVNLVIHGPSFTLSSSQYSVTVNQGGIATPTITVNGLYGFTGSVNLQVSGLPAGLTASFGTNPTSSASVLTLAASSSAVSWAGAITVTGTSGSLTASTLIYVSLVAPTFTLSTSGTYTIGQGTSTTTYISVLAQNGFTGNVTLSVSGLPDGVSVVFTPNPITGSGGMTIIANSNAAIGSSNVTITGTSGLTKVSTTMNLTIKSPGFTLGGSGSVSLGQGTSNTTYIYINDQYGFNGTVALSASGLPAGVTAAFSANPTAFSSNLTLTASSSAAPGTYTINITGTAGAITASTTVTVTVGVPTFTIYPPSSQTLSQSGSVTGYVSLNSQFGFNGNVTLSISGLPAGVTGSFSTNPATYSSQLVLNASSTVAAGNYTATITGTSGSITSSASMPLTIVAPGIQISTSNSVTLGIGTSATTWASVYGNSGFSGNATLSVSGLPSGITVSFSTNPVNLPASNSSVLTFTASGSVAPGSYAVTLSATSGSVTASTAITILVATPSFTLSGVSSMAISQGSSAYSYVSVNGANGFNGNVTLSLSGLPSGVSAAFGTNPTTNSSSITFSATNAAAVGTFPITVTGTSGSATATSTIALTVSVPAFTLNAGQSTLTVVQGASYQSYLYVNGTNGFSGPVTLSASGLPSGVTATFGTNPTTYYTSMTFVASGTAAPGTSTVTITGTYGSTTSSTTLQLTVGAPSFLLNPVSGLTLSLGGTARSSIGISVSNGFNSNVVFSIAGLPSNVTASWNPTSSTTGSILTLTANSGALPGTTTATITGTSGALFATTSLPITIRTLGSSSETTLTISSGGSAVTSSAWGTLVTLTASVNASGTPVTSGLVKFCDSTASYCGDIHLLGSAQLNSNGTASMNLLPLPGSQSYKAVFAGTASYSASSSSTGSLQVTGGYPTTASLTSSGAVGNYTLNATVGGAGTHPLSGSISFIDTSNNNSSIASASLVAGTPSLSWSQLGTTATGSSSGAMVSGDFNGDGISDVAILAPNFNAFTVHIGNADGTFTRSNLSPQTSSSPNAIITADFNHDGLLDVAVLAQYGMVNIFLGNGDGAFTALGSSTNIATSTSGIVSGDFNGDGIPDLAIGDANNNKIVILLGQGDGTFITSSTSPAAAQSPQRMTVADFNGDGYPDIAVGSYSAPLTLLVGNGDGTFYSVPNTLSPGTSPMSMMVADFNGDGKPDMAIASYYSPTLAVFLGNGDGTFTAASSPAVVSYANSMVPIDVDQDGIVDLVVTSGSNSNASVLLGKGDGTFTPGSNLVLPDTAIGAVAGNATSNGYKTVIASFQSLSEARTLQPYLAQSATASTTGISMGATGSHKVAASYSGDASYAASQSQTVTINGTKSDSIITWPPPTPIVYGTILDSTQLNATANTPGAFVYTPAAGVVLGAGTKTLSVTFTPTDTANYTTVTATVTLVVNQAAPTITWATPAAITFGTALNSSQLNATANTPGTFTYLPAAGAVPAVGVQTLSTTFTPTDATDYTTAAATVTLNVNPATPTITWATPAAITYGTALSAAQLNASSTVPGDFVYTPALGTVLPAGNQALSVTFTPTETSIVATTKIVQLAVNKATPAITLTTSTSFQFQSDPVIFTATLDAAGAGGSPTGTLTFNDGATVLGNASLTNGMATFATSSLSVGAHSITAAYSGDSNYAAAGSASALNQTIGTMTISSTGSGGSTVEASAGGQAAFNLTFTPPNGQTFPQAIQLGVSGLPTGATASFSPNQIPAGSGTTAVTLTISVPTTASAEPLKSPFGGGTLPIALGLALLPFAGRLRRAGRKLRRGSHALLIVIAGVALTTALALGLSGCGGSSSGGGSGSSPSRTYPLTLTATSGAYSQTTTLTLVVK